MKSRKLSRKRRRVTIVSAAAASVVAGVALVPNWSAGAAVTNDPTVDAATKATFQKLADAVFTDRTQALVDDSSAGKHGSKHHRLTSGFSGKVRLSGTQSREENTALTQLRGRKAVLAKLGEKYSGARTNVTLDATQVKGRQAKVAVTETTTLTYRKIRGNEPKTTGFQAHHELTFQADSKGNWQLTGIHGTDDGVAVNQVRKPPVVPKPPAPPSTKAPTATPATKAPSSIPTTKAPSPVPTTKAPSSIPTTKAPSPVPTTKAPSPVPTTKAPTTAPVPSTTAPVPSTTAPVPSTTAPAPVPSTTAPTVANSGNPPAATRSATTTNPPAAPKNFSASGYDYKAMADYAAKHWSNYNKDYPSFDGAGAGGDCTNFVSQALKAGGWKHVPGYVYDHTKWFGNSEIQSHSFIGVNEFSWFALSSQRVTGLANVYQMDVGDVLQVDFNRDGSKDHTMIVSYRSPQGVPYLSYHSTNTYNRSVASIIASYPNAYYYAYRT
ncbi:amidase domain-containing protein [Streptomyces kebangsaanensis]|uniref:amidase domain-containing protein n=1 Tax=Streptomyces kebangsaanensis TaxID=864058 RepID=UPI000A419506|nr:amidase domain-containing protein [Streptomyces kebangsaanensis]